IEAAVGPDRMGNTSERNQPRVIALLVAVVDGGAREHTVAIVLIRAYGRHSGVGTAPVHSTVCGLRKVDICLIAVSCAIVARVVEGDIHAAVSRIYREPLVKTIHQP